MSLVTPLTSGGLKRAATALFGVADPTLAVNAGDFANYTSGYPTLDFSKHMNAWDSVAGNYSALIAAGHIDAETTDIISNGTASPFTKTILTQAGDFITSKQFRLRWEGAGTLSFSSPGTVDATATNEITFTPSTDTMQISCPAGSGAVENVSLVETQYTSRYDAGERIHPDYVTLNADMRMIRFMDWNHINGCTQTNWSSRPIASQNSYTADLSDTNANHKSGVPLELMIELCNRAMCDLYFCFPADCTYSDAQTGGASENYFRQAMILIRDTLNTNLKAFLEVSNEVWNGGFPVQISHLAQLANVLWPDASGETEYLRAQAALGWKTWQMSQIAAEVFAGQTSRYHITIGVNVGNYLEALGDVPADSYTTLWETHAGDGNATSGAYVAPYTICDSLAITSYFGTPLVYNATHRAAIVAAYPATSDSVIDGLLRQSDPDNIFGQPDLFSDNWSAFNAIALARSIGMIQYEGGPHMIYGNELVPSDPDYATAFDACRQWTRSSLGATMASENYAQWQTYSQAIGPYMQFWDVHASTGFGDWAIRDHMGATPEGFFAQLLTENAAGGQWYSDARDFRHGVI